MGLGTFLKNAFKDMKDSAKAQHEVDKANFRAAKAESKAKFVEARAMGRPETRKKMMQAQRDAQINEANARISAALSKIQMGAMWVFTALRSSQLQPLDRPEIRSNTNPETIQWLNL